MKYFLLNSNKYPKILESAEKTVTIADNVPMIDLVRDIVSIPSGYKFVGGTVVVTGANSSHGYWQFIGYSGDLNNPAVLIKHYTGASQTWKYKAYIYIVPS